MGAFMIQLCFSILILLVTILTCIVAGNEIKNYLKNNNTRRKRTNEKTK